MTNNNILYAFVPDLIKDAKKAGHNAIITINGEIYAVVPESVPEIIEEDEGDADALPFK